MGLEEAFNPTNKKYEKVAHLPEDKRKEFRDVEGGFVKEKAYENLNVTKLAAGLEGAKPLDLLHTEALDYVKIREELLKELDNEKDEMDYYNDLADNKITLEEFKIHKNKKEQFESTLEKEDLFSDRDFVLRAIEKKPYYIYRLAPEEIRKDKEILMAALNNDKLSERSAGYLVDYIPDNLKKDKEVVITLIKKRRHLLFEHEDIKEEFKNDSDVILAIMDRWGKKDIERIVGEELLAKINSKRENNAEKLSEAA